MPDLMPDTSIYQHVGQGNQLDLGRLLATAGAARQLQSQSAISQALKSTVNPQTGQPDPNAALGALVKDPNVYLGPEDVTQFTHAQRAQSELSQWYMGQAASALSSLITKPHPTVADFNVIAPRLARYGVPSSMISDLVSSAKGPNGELDTDKLQLLHNWVHENSGVPIREVQGVGANAQIPAGSAGFRGTAVPTPQPRPAPAPAPGAMPGATPAPPIDDHAMMAADEVRKSSPQYGLGGTVPGSAVVPSDTAKASMATSVASYNQQQAASQHYQNDVTPLGKMIDLLKKMGPQATGKGTEGINDIKNFLYTMTGVGNKAQIDSISNYEQLRKYMAQQIDAMSAGGTDSRLWQASGANPNTELTQQSNLALARILLGLRRKDQVAISEFGRTNLPKEQYLDWRQRFEPQQDTAGYMWDKMDRGEQEAFIKQHRLNPNDPEASKKALGLLRSSRAAAERSGVFTGTQ